MDGFATALDGKTGAVGVEAAEVDFGGLAADGLREQAGGAGGEQDAIAIVAGGDPVVAMRGGFSNQREIVGGSGAKSGPGLKYLGIGDGRVEFGGSVEKAGDGMGFDGLVESSLLDGSADGDASFVARNKINIWSAEDLLQPIAASEADGDHLPFYWQDGRLAGRQEAVGAEGGESGPGSGTVDEVGGGDRFGEGLDGEASVGFGVDGDNGVVLADGHFGGFGGQRQGGAEVARVEALLLDEEEVVFAGVEVGDEGGCFGGGKPAVVADFGKLRQSPRMAGLERDSGAEGDSFAGEVFDSGKVVGVEIEAMLGEFSEFWRIFRVVRREHASRGPGGFRHRQTAVQNDDTDSVGRKIEGKGESDDACAGDDYFG